MSKSCSQCGEVKSLSDFRKDSRAKDGTSSECKACLSARGRKWRQANKGQIAERRSAYRNRPEVRERERSRMAKYNRENRGRINELARKRRSEDPEPVRERERAYREVNPHTGWVTFFNQRAKAAGFDPVVESFTKADVIERYGDACFYCGGDFEHLDHYVPVSKGGPHALDNVRPSCASCNFSKSSKTPHAAKEQP